MKKEVTIFGVLALVAGVIGFKWQQTPEPPRVSDLTLANIEALTIDLEEIEILCSKGSGGLCFLPNYTEQMVMCGEQMVQPCIFTGVAADFCYWPCK